MLLLGCLSAAMIAAPAVYVASNPRTRDLKRRISSTLQALKMEGVRIERVEHLGKDVSHAVIRLPFGLAASDFREKAMEPLEQSTFATVLMEPIDGCLFKLKFGFRRLSGMVRYIEQEYQTGPLEIPLETPFGLTTLDLKDDSSCMVLGGGATRMGKTSLIHLIATHSLISTNGRCKVILCSTKNADFHPFKSIPQVTIAGTDEEVVTSLIEVTVEMNRRKERLNAAGNVKDIHSYRRKYPDNDPMDPILVIVDEFGAYEIRDKKDEEHIAIHEAATEIACRAGYVDIHLLAFSQRTDVTNVIPKQVRANTLCKISFTTADENNSRLVIGLPDAAHLGAKKGRAILVDGMPKLVQVPYLSEEDMATLLKPYVKDEVNHDAEGQNAVELSQEVSNPVEGPLGESDLPRSSPPAHHDKPNRKTARKGRTPAPSPAAQRSLLSVLSESGAD